MLEESDLPDLAGPGAYERGVGYFRERRVRLTRRLADGFDARARGTAEYQLRFRDRRAGMEWQCSCPAAADGAFCKHLVAGTLAWLDEAKPGGVFSCGNGLRGHLERESRETLVHWLHEALQQDPALARRFELERSQDDPRVIKKMLASVLNVSGFVEYHRSTDLAAALDAPLDALRDLLRQDAAQCLALCNYALRRLLRVYANSDDSAGALGQATRELADLHARAAKRGVFDRTGLAASLLFLKRHEDWDLFPLERYWEPLGREGRAAYSEQVRAEYAGLLERTTSLEDIELWAREFPVVKRREELARVEGDFDVLIEVLSRNLSSGHAYERLVAACREFGRQDEALAWAVRGLEAHRDWPGMRSLAAELLRDAGRRDEARELLWEDFCRRPGIDTWRRLKAGAGRQWPELRVRALAAVADAEWPDGDGPGDASLRLRLLWADGDLDAARALARLRPVDAGLLADLGRKVAGRHPADAVDFLVRAVDADLVRADARTYGNIVSLMRQAWRLGPGEQLAQWFAGIRARYRARRKLMRLMDEAGLPPGRAAE